MKLIKLVMENGDAFQGHKGDMEIFVLPSRLELLSRELQS